MAADNEPRISAELRQKIRAMVDEELPKVLEEIARERGESVENLKRRVAAGAVGGADDGAVR